MTDTIQGREKNPNAVAVGERIRDLRRKIGFSQENLASELGYSNKTIISEWENGTRLPGTEKIISLSEIFDVSTDFLLKGIDKNCNECKYRLTYISVKSIFSDLE